MEATTATLHPFEAAGMGNGPYKFLYCCSLPSASLAEQNPDAYRNAHRELPRDISGGLGTCRNCGMAIMNICIVQDAQGIKYGVGSDCVEKTGDRCIGTPANVAVARMVAKKRREAKEAARIAKAKAFAESPEGIARAAAEKAKEEALAELHAKRITDTMAKFEFVLPYLARSSGSFCTSIADQIRNGYAPTGRALEIVQDIYSSAHGRRNSKAYADASDDFAERLG